MTERHKNAHTDVQCNGPIRWRIDNFIDCTKRDVFKDLENSHSSLVIVSRLLKNCQEHNIEIYTLEPSIITFNLNEQVQGSQPPWCRTKINVTDETTVKKYKLMRSEEWSADMMEVLAITKKLLHESDKVAFKNKDEFLDSCANNMNKQKKANLFLTTQWSHIQSNFKLN